MLARARSKIRAACKPETSQTGRRWDGDNASLRIPNLVVSRLDAVVILVQGVILVRLYVQFKVYE